MTTTTIKGFNLYQIEPPFGAQFCEDRQTNDKLSDFHAWALRKAGDAIRPRGSQHFWLDGEYCWYTDASQTIIHRVWQTSTGILIYEDGEYLYRVQPI